MVVYQSFYCIFFPLLEAVMSRLWVRLKLPIICFSNGWLFFYSKFGDFLATYLNDCQA